MFGAISCFGMLSPFEDRLEGPHFFEAEQSLGMQRFQLQAAKVIVSAFEICSPDRPVKDAFKQRNVLVENLILESFGSRRNQNAPAVHQCGQQVGQGFTGACPRFDDDLILVLERTVDRLRHANLRRPEFVILQPLFKHAARSEKIIHRVLKV